MDEQETPVEKIYVAKVDCEGGKQFEGRYAVHHNFQYTPESGISGHLSYDLSRDNLVGYLEGANAIPSLHVRKVINGIPRRVRGGFFLNLRLLILKMVNLVQ